MDIEIIEASPQELDELMEWRIRVLQEVFSIAGNADMTALEKANRTYYKQHLADDTHVACLAKTARTQKTVGCGGICYESEMPSPDNPSGTCGYIMNVYVLPDYRKMGIGRKIVQHLIDDAQSRDTGKVYLESSDAGESLYADLGFEEMAGYMRLPRQG